MKKILIIENDQILLEYNFSLLTENGFNVITSNCSMEGITKANELIPDLIISTINSHDAHEFEICKAMQSDPSTSFIPIIFITESSMDIQIGMQIGADDFLSKPFSSVQLLSKVKNILTNQKSTIY